MTSAYQQMSDEELMLRVQCDDQQAFEGLSSRYRFRTKIFFRTNIKFSILNYRYSVSVDDDDDLTQRVWIKIWIKRHTFRAEHKFKPWLKAIERNTFIDWIRLQKRQVPIEPENNMVDILDEQVDEIDQMAFERAWNQLSPKEQEILCKIYNEGCTRRKVANELEISLPKLRKMERKMIEKLAQYLTEEGILVETIELEAEAEEEAEENKKEVSQEPTKEVGN